MKPPNNKRDLGEYVEPGHDVVPDLEGDRRVAQEYAERFPPLRYRDKEEKLPDGTAVRRLEQQLVQQIAALTDAIDRLQQRMATVEEDIKDVRSLYHDLP